jgi:hypothetical protein
MRRQFNASESRRLPMLGFKTLTAKYIRPDLPSEFVSIIDCD